MFNKDLCHEEDKFLKEALRYSATVMQSVSMLAYLYFTTLEVMGGMVTDFLGYLTDPWNICDFLIIFLTTIF